MIEIVLREDIRKFETKPLFGYSYRQAGAGIACIVCSFLTYNLAAPVLPSTFAFMLTMTVGGLIGFIGWGKPAGLKPEVWARIRYEEWEMPATLLYQRPHLARPERSGPKPGRADRKRLKREMTEPEYAL